METKALSNLGLTKREIELYLKLMELGEAPAGELASKTTVSRTHVYEAMDSLLTKGLTCYEVRHFKRFYKATSPERLKYVAQRTLDQIDELIPELKKLKKAKLEGVRIEAFRGTEGIKLIYEDMLAVPNEEILVINVKSVDISKEDWQPKFMERYKAKKKEKNVKSRVLADKKIEHKDPQAEIRYLPGMEDTLTMTLIYRNKVALIFWIRDENNMVIEDQVIATLIKSEQNAIHYRRQFEVLWQAAQPV